MSFRLICRLGKVYKGALGAVAVLSLFSYTASATAPTDFLKKVPISLSASMQTALGQETLSGFPVLVRLSTAISGFSYADIAANHSDIAFGTDDGSTITPYPFEVVEWDPNGTSLVWVRVPSLAAASSFNFYYGNGGSVANTPSDTWAGYAGVWHLNEASGTAFDATANGLDATPSGANAAECVAVSTAPTGTGRQLASAKGHKSYLSVPDYDSLGLGGTFTISAWVKADACYTSYSARYFSRKDEYTDKNGWEVEQRYDTGKASVPATTISARGANSGDYTATVPDITKNWAYVVISYNGTTLQYYVNGNKAETRTLNNAATDNGKPLSFGIDSDGDGSNWVGAMDEIRLRGFVPTEAWEAAEYAVVADPSCLVYGAVEPLDPTAPRFAGAPTVVGANGAFTFSATLAAGEGDLYMVFTDLATGVATTNPVATNVSTPDVYAATPSLVAGSTYDYAVLGVSPSGTPILNQGDSPVYAGEVTIAQVADADETTMTNGSFIVSRGSSTTGNLVVSYTVGGTAVADETYERLSGTVTIPDGDSTATIVVTPIFSFAVEEDVTVVATLAPGAYLAGTPDNATVTIVNSTANPYERYVTTDGNDANDGFTIATAKATLQAAIDSLDAVSAENDCTVYVAPGTYVQPYNSTYCVYVTNRVAVVGVTGDPADVVIDRGSTSSAIFCVNNANAVLRGLTVVRGNLNGGKGPGVYLASGAVEDCVVSNCTGQAWDQSGIGVYAEGGRVSRCRISRNTNNNDYCSGVGLYASGSALVEDCLVDRNTCKQGGAVYLAGSATFLNCTVVKNTGSYYAGVRVGSNSARAVNCAIFGNTVDHITEGSVYNAGYGARFERCAADLPIEGGVDCLFVQPVFRDVEHGDYRPASGSPLIDAGAARSGYGAVSTTDFDGLARVSGTVDIGCFENAKDAAECGFTWSASQYTLPAQVTLHADSFGIDSPVYDWTFHNENTGVDVAATGKDTVWDLAETDAGTYTLSLSVGGVSYTSPERLVVSQPVLYASSGNAAAAFPYDTEAAAAPNIATAVAAAGEGATICVKPGEYLISSQIKVSKGIRILGTGAKYTDVVVTNTANGGETRIFALQHPDAFVANLTMAGGRASGGHEGGNLFIYGKGGTVSNCLLTAGRVNAQWQQGGGAAVLHAGTLTHCEITRCNAIPNANNTAPRVLSASGISASRPVRISNCLIHDCDATEGDNATRGKGSLLNIGARATLENCTVANCTVVAGAEAVYLTVVQSKYNESAKLVNCAVFVRDGNGDVAPITGNTAWDTFWPRCVFNCASESEISAYITSNNGKGWYYGKDCIVTNAAACFRDVAQGDYRLKDDSPLVDMGIDNEGMASIDFARKNRKVGKFVDIGCYELPKRTFAIIVR